MNPNLYDAENCPCKKDCDLHGNCDSCKIRHHARGELTRCEEVAVINKKQKKCAIEPIISGKQVRLLDYGACAG